MSKKVMPPLRSTKELKKALIKIHYQCNNNCVFCHAEEKRKRKPLNFSQITEKIVLARWLPADLILLSGGEPTAHPDFLKLINFLAKREIPFGLVTNGRAFSSGQFTKVLKNKGLNYVYLTLHSSDETLHDKIAGAKGAFKETSHGLKNLCRLGMNDIEIIVNTVVIKSNLNKLKSIINFLSKFRDSISRIKFTLVEPRGAAFANFERTVPNLGKGAEKINSALEYGLKKNLNVYWDNLPFCLVEENLRERRDDLRSNNIRWMSETFEKKFYPVDEGDTVKPAQCKGCAYFKKCPGIFEKYIQKRGDQEIIPQ